MLGLYFSTDNDTDGVRNGQLCVQNGSANAPKSADTESAHNALGHKTFVYFKAIVAATQNVWKNVNILMKKYYF